MARRAGLNEAIKADAGGGARAPTRPRRSRLPARTPIFANDGAHVTPTDHLAGPRPRWHSAATSTSADPRNTLDPRVNYLMVSMMQDVLRYGTGAGCARAGFNLPAAGKTGTSHDGWFAGFTSDLLCVVWVGFDDNRELNLEGAKSALPIWADFMKRAAKLRHVSGCQPSSRRAA